MRKKKVDLTCDSCDLSFSVQHSTKEPVLFCTFCGEELTINKAHERPLLDSFEELDEFDEETYIDDDEDYSEEE